MSWALLFDATRCIGCGACSAACKEQNQLPLPIEDRTTAYTWTVVERKGGVNVRRMCMHCLTPTCVSVCPVAAMTKQPRSEERRVGKEARAGGSAGESTNKQHS